MIQIVQSDDFELRINGIDPSSRNIRRDKEVYSKIVGLHEKNFSIWLKASKSKKDIEKYQREKSSARFPENPTRHSRQFGYKWDNEFEKVRPYFYTYKGDYYFLHSPLISYHEATIILLESNDILSILEKNLSGLGVLGKLKRRTTKVPFVMDADQL